MSNRNRKATGGSSFQDKKLKNAEKTIENLQEQVRAARMSVLNQRQMVEAANQENDILTSRLDQAVQIITAATLQERKNRLVLKEATFSELAEYVGYDLDDDDGDLIITPVHRSELEKEEEE